MILSPLKTFPIAGHSNNDPGAVYNGRKEAEETKCARELLIQHFPKKNDIIADKDEQSLNQVLKSMKPGIGSVLLDSHFNAGPPTASGTECFVNAKDFANKNSRSYKMANEICKAASAILGIPNRGIKSERQTRHKRLGVLNIGAGCSVLWEICFISNNSDMKKWDLKKVELMKVIASICQKYDDMK